MAARGAESSSSAPNQSLTVSELQEIIKEKQREIAYLRKVIAKRRQAVDPRQIRMFE